MYSGADKKTLSDLYSSFGRFTKMPSVLQHCRAMVPRIHFTLCFNREKKQRKKMAVWKYLVFVLCVGTHQILQLYKSMQLEIQFLILEDYIIATDGKDLGSKVCENNCIMIVNKRLRQKLKYQRDSA